MTVSGTADEPWVLEWSLGPVQAFVTAARRTRDMWGGSYLLSLLVAEAIAAADLADEDFEVPAPVVVRDDPFVAARRAARRGQDANERLPVTASLPNHVRLKLPAALAQRVAGTMRDAVQGLWGALAGQVWQRHLSGAEPAGQGTKAIWDRQVGAFWEVTWVAGPLPPQGSLGLLARRKLWRSHLLPDEPGDRCMVMPEWQELSGFVRARGKAERQQQEDFWELVRQSTGDLDVRPDERLSAPAMVKRLWPRVAGSVVAGVPDVEGWPSTWHFALAPWLKKLTDDHGDEALRYRGTVARLLPGHCGRRARPPLPGAGEHAIWGVEPELFYLSGVRATRDGQLVQAYRELCQAAGGEPSSYFAVVVADGDRLGRLVSKQGSGKVGPGLAEFAKSARRVAERHHAVVVYAGGDDVLAFASVGEGLGFADELAKSYQQCLADAGAEGATMSAAVVFAHARSPLSEALATARRLLDAEAKEGNGRASVAVALAKGSVTTAQWASAFDAGPAGGAQAVELLSGLVEAWRLGSGKLSSSALYRVADIARRYLDLGQEGSANQTGLAGATSGPGADSAAGADGVLRALFANELARTEQVTGRGADAREALELADEVLWCMGRHRGPEVAVAADGATRDGRGTDGATRYQLGVLDLVHFLSTSGQAEL
ncbi:MAG: Cas10/Cmr2 second palm domain-containing protein [Acidimicrobiales bacterium]